jgi:hypothetical protein
VAPADARGVALVDVLPALALTALLSATTIPVVAGTLERERAALGAQYLATRIAETQLEALRRGVTVALRFRLDEDDVAWQAFADGNGNGVLSRDIADGIDHPIGPEERLGRRARHVSLRINQAVPDAGGGAQLEPGSDPLRIGPTNLVACAPTGSLTGGTLYVASPGGPQFAVRVTGSTGRVRVLRFDRSTRQWWP